MTTRRQQQWLDAAESSDSPARELFLLIAQPNEHEREHSCNGHYVGFRRDGRRGIKCGICRKVVRWVDPEETDGA